MSLFPSAQKGSVIYCERRNWGSLEGLKGWWIVCTGNVRGNWVMINRHCWTVFKSSIGRRSCRFKVGAVHPARWFSLRTQQCIHRIWKVASGVGVARGEGKTRENLCCSSTAKVMGIVCLQYGEEGPACHSEGWWKDYRLRGSCCRFNKWRKWERGGKSGACEGSVGSLSLFQIGWIFW